MARQGLALEGGLTPAWRKFPPARRARSVAIRLMLLNLRWSSWMAGLSERASRFEPLQTFIDGTEYSVATFMSGALRAIYEGARERNMDWLCRPRPMSVGPD